jgi:hypothetical protein
MLQPRDILIIEYLKTHGEADTRQLKDLFFAEVQLHRAEERLRILTTRGYLKRRKDVDNRYYIYSIGGIL